tara:strand:+ start:84 stop:281 length:198 start_codon:yes stop_codon:yes gene_type:complete
MTTNIVKSPEFTIVTPYNKQLFVGDSSGDVVSRFVNFRRMANVMPVAIEDRFFFAFEDVCVQIVS